MSGRLDEHLIKALTKLWFFLETVENMDPDCAAKTEDLIAHEISLMHKSEQRALSDGLMKLASSTNDPREKRLAASLPQWLGLGLDE